MMQERMKQMIRVIYLWEMWGLLENGAYAQRKKLIGIKIVKAIVYVALAQKENKWGVLENVAYAQSKKTYWDNNCENNCLLPLGQHGKKFKKTIAFTKRHLRKFNKCLFALGKHSKKCLFAMLPWR